jgi:hypothetical protein
MKRTGFASRVKPLSGVLRTASLKASGKPTIAAKPKTRKCEVCQGPFVKQRMGQVVCGPGCAVVYTIRQKEKESRKQLKLQKATGKPLKVRLKEAEKAVNFYVRMRDARLGCCSCDKPAHWDGQWHASHFKSVGSNSLLRFHLWNIHKGCSECNRHLAGNIPEYKERLKLKIGAEKLQWIEDRKNGTREYTAEYLDRLKQIFNKKARRLEKRIKDEVFG